MAGSTLEKALDLFRQAWKLQMRGELERAIELYKRSIAVHPTAEAHTFLGWTYSFQGRLEDAIAECKRAIEVDPAFGNPYNDIGAYLIELGRPGEAIPWLEKATVSKRYETYHFPWYNLGRAYVLQELYTRAKECFQRAVEIEPEYTLAREALEKTRRLIQ
jgi:tetratricopeptide (TPR) repeat protein